MTTPHPGERPAGYAPAATALHPNRPTSRTASAVLTAALLLPVASLIIIVLPTTAAVALAGLSAMVTGIARTGFWLLGDRPGPDATLLALRAGAVTMAAGMGVTGLMLLLGPVSVQVLALTMVVTLLYLWATRR